MISVISEGVFLNKPKNIKKYNDGKVIFEACLQEADVVNRNNRLYSKNVLQEGIEKIQTRIQNRAFVGELDHPIDSNQIRQTTVEYKTVSHIITEVWWDGNLLKALVETTPYTECGKILSGLLLDGVPVGFSLRGLADVEDRNNYQKVLPPLSIIAYDAVSDPSNKKATVQEIKKESFVSIVKETSQYIKCDNGVCYLPDYFDELIERGILKLLY